MSEILSLKCAVMQLKRHLANKYDGHGKLLDLFRKVEDSTNKVFYKFLNESSESESSESSESESESSEN